jgi:hypothetical protein
VSLGSKKLATSERSFTRIVDFQLLKSVESNLRHAITRRVTVTTGSLLTFIKVSHSKIE